MPFIVAEVRKTDRDRWQIFLSDEMGPQASGRTRKEVLVKFKDGLLSSYGDHSILFLIYTDLWRIEQVWCFRRGRGRRIAVKSWMRCGPGK